MTVEEFAQHIEEQSKKNLVKMGMGCEANLKNCETHIHQGRKWTRVDVGSSGAYMINKEGEIYGIKAYGVPHLGHRYGTLDNPVNLRDHWGKFA